MSNIDIKRAAKKVVKLRHSLGKRTPKPKETSGEVKRVEGNTAYVRFDGSDIDTPVNISHACLPGDTVRVRIGDDHKAWTMGNVSRPPTDDRVANVARRVANEASNTAIQAEETAIAAENNSESALSSAAEAASSAIEAKQIAGDTNQYFWHKETDDGTGDTGAHITEVSREEWDDPNSENYRSGGNLLARSNGIAIRSGLEELASFGTDIYLGNRVHVGSNEIRMQGSDGQGNTVDYLYITPTSTLIRSRHYVLNNIGILKYFVTPQMDNDGFHVYIDRAGQIGEGLEAVEITKDGVFVRGTNSDLQQKHQGNYIYLYSGNGTNTIFSSGYFDSSGNEIETNKIDKYFGSSSKIYKEDLNILSPFTNYNDMGVVFKRAGNVCEIQGVVKPTQAIAGSDTKYQICQLPDFYPEYHIREVMQGSGGYVWLCEINTKGAVSFSRYRASSSFEATSTSTWLPFHITWLVDIND